MVYDRENAPKVGAGTAHEGVAEATEIGAVTHFLVKYIGDIVFTTDVGDGNGAIGDPFACGIFSVLNVTIPLGGHVVTPFDASVIVIVERCRRVAIRDGLPRSERLEIMLRMLTVRREPMLVARISASQELSDVRS
jgi:hypothetical protein